MKKSKLTYAQLIALYTDLENGKAVMGEPDITIALGTAKNSHYFPGDDFACDDTPPLKSLLDKNHPDAGHYACRMHVLHRCLQVGWGEPPVDVLSRGAEILRNGRIMMMQFYQRPGGDLWRVRVYDVQPK